MLAFLLEQDDGRVLVKFEVVRSNAKQLAGRSSRPLFTVHCTANCCCKRNWPYHCSLWARQLNASDMLACTPLAAEVGVNHPIK